MPKYASNLSTNDIKVVDVLVQISLINSPLLTIVVFTGVIKPGMELMLPFNCF